MRKIEIIILAVSLSPLTPEGGILPGTMAEPVLSRTPLRGLGGYLTWIKSRTSEGLLMHRKASIKWSCAAIRSCSGR
ncbi:MAG: hypothetical protein H7Y04_07300 [Verrucomicrobia bacterium]|nr:hypothetical protein [Cytophagales bacterium]